MPSKLPFCLVTFLFPLLLSAPALVAESTYPTLWQLADGSDIPAGARFVPPKEKVSGKFTPPDIPGKVSASVEVEVIVGLNGGVAAVYVQSERPELIPAALAASEATKYEPATLDGKAVAVSYTHRYVYEKD